MANDMDMLRDIEDLRNLGEIEQADALERLYHYKYGLGDVISERNFEKLKQEYIRKYDGVDNYI